MLRNFYYLVAISLFIGVASCQKSVADDELSGNQGDSPFVPGDSLTYEVITTDTSGWYGMWMKGDGTSGANTLDSGTYGSPHYLPSGWRYTFAVSDRPFQAMMSVSPRLYADDITVNLYKNDILLKSVMNNPAKSFAQLLFDVNTDSVTGTATAPVLTYEVLVTPLDTAKFQSDRWYGHWAMSNGILNDVDNPYHTNQPLLMLFGIPSGWRYTFRPDQLPFTMRMQAMPYTIGGGLVTVNFFVNGRLVQSKSTSDNAMYPPAEYTVQ